MRFNARLSVLIINVLASPGTPSSRQCPRLNSEISNSSITCGLADDHLAQLVDDLLAGAAELLDGAALVKTLLLIAHGGSSLVA